jgi:hypothetical protein
MGSELDPVSSTHEFMQPVLIDGLDWESLRNKSAEGEKLNIITI